MQRKKELGPEAAGIRWKMEDGRWKMETGDQRSEARQRASDYGDEHRGQHDILAGQLPRERRQGRRRGQYQQQTVGPTGAAQARRGQQQVHPNQRKLNQEKSEQYSMDSLCQAALGGGMTGE